MKGEDKKYRATWFNAGPTSRIKASLVTSGFALNSTQQLRLQQIQKQEGLNVPTAQVPDSPTRKSSEFVSPSGSEERIDVVEVSDTVPMQVNATTESIDSLVQMSSRGPDPALEGSDVIVIHPGHQNLRIGFASSSLPITVPNVISRYMLVPPTKSTETTQSPSVCDENVREEQVLSFSSSMESIIKMRMKTSKLRPVPNAEAQVQSYNESDAAQNPEQIADHNDPFRMEWLYPDLLDETCYFGEEALLIAPSKDANNDDSCFRLFHPLRYGKMNGDDYKSIEHWKCDLEAIWTHVLEKELKVNKKDLKRYSVVLVIPDMFDKATVLHMIDVLITRLEFAAFNIMLEGTCAAFGAGVSYACVVDVGSSHTTVCCVEDGYVLPETRFRINYGGDDITHVLEQILRYRSHFPYQDFKLSQLHDFLTMESLKEHYCTLSENEVVSQVYECFIRAPYKQTLKYLFKIYDEAMMPPLSLFYPAQFMLRDKALEHYFEATSSVYSARKDEVSEVVENVDHLHPVFAKPKEWTSEMAEEALKLHQQKESEESPESMDTDKPPVSEVPLNAYSDMGSLIELDNAIVISIASSSPRLIANYVQGSVDPEFGMTLTDEERMRRLYNSILLVGGGLALFTGVSQMLGDHVLAKFRYINHEMFKLKPKDLKIDSVQVLASPRDIDPQIVTWKGAAISCRLESILRDCWTTRAEWKCFGEILLKDRLLFDFEAMSYSE